MPKMWSRRVCLSALAGLTGTTGLMGLEGLVGHRKAHAATDEDQPKPGRALQWPRDFGSHPGTRIEWWYVTGALRMSAGSGPWDFSGSDDLLGFQITFFRSRTPVADRPNASGNRLSPHHLLFAHAALTDVRAGRLMHAERITRWNGKDAKGLATLGSEPFAQASREDTDVRIGRWHLNRTGPHDESRYQGAWHDDDANFGLKLTLQTSQPVLLQGAQGYSRKSPRPGHASGYYSQPQMQARGELLLNGQRRPVHGIAWLDHEWSSSLLDLDAVGWDWMGMNLADGSALTVFRLRRADGSMLWAGGSWRPPGRAVRPFESREVQMRPGREWASAATGARYPVEWSIETPAGRHTVRALVDAQELDNRQRTGTVYWEGISSLHDEEGRRIGLGYLEMTGYAGRLQL